MAAIRKLSDYNLHDCDSTVVEWAELVSRFLHQDWSLWKHQLWNLHVIQQQP